MEVLLASWTVLQRLCFLVHFSKADDAVSVIFQVDVLRAFLVVAS
jgi:hypothetical protein